MLREQKCMEPSDKKSAHAAPPMLTELGPERGNCIMIQLAFVPEHQQTLLRRSDANSFMTAFDVKAE